MNEGTIYPSTPIELAIDEADIFFKVQEWPMHYRELLNKGHKISRERFRLWTFLVANGMQPSTAVRWVLWHGGYDNRAHAESSSWILRYSQDPMWFKQYKSWDMIQKRNI